MATHFSRRIWFFFLALGLSGCGKTLSLSVQHPPLSHLEARHRHAASKIYVIVETPDAEALLYKASGYYLRNQEEARAYPKIDGSALARALLDRYAQLGLSPLGFQLVGSGQKWDRFVPMMNAAGVLHVTLEPVALSVTKVETKDKKGQALTNWQARAVLPGSYRLMTPDGSAILVSEKFIAAITDNSPMEIEAAQWFAGQKGMLWKEAADILSSIAKTPEHFNAQSVRRKVLPSKKNGKIQQGFDLAQKGDWAGAEKLWQQAARDENHSLAHHNLAVYYENIGQFEKAMTHYQSAKASYEKDRSKIEGRWFMFPTSWDDAMWKLRFIEEDHQLGGKSSPAASNEESIDWFKRRLAVLPFTNESNFIDAPDFLRRLAQTQLRGQGYAVINLEETDVNLRQMGITQGGQLAAFKSPKIAEALSADLLLYGDVLGFNEIPIGVYHKREVELSLRLVDSKTGNAIWESNKRILYESSNKGEKVGKQLIKQLTQSLVEKAAKVPLKEESEEVISRSLALLPSR